MLFLESTNAIVLAGSFYPDEKQKVIEHKDPKGNSPK